MKVWFITDETPLPPSSDFGLSLVGLFFTKEKALDYLKDWILGSESFSSIEWKQSEYNPDYHEGFGASRIYILSTQEIDEE